MATQTQPPTLLRDLSDAGFEDAYDCDRFTAAVLSNRLRYAVQHVATGLLHRAFSPVLALSYDFAASVCAPPEQGYQMVAVTNSLTVFLGTMADGVRVAVEEYGPERLGPGDLLICNDPSRMGNHPNDICFIRPVFHDGAIACFMVLRAHQIDVGGSIPGGFSGSKRSTYENGLVISPRLMFCAEEPVRETFSLIFDNVRLGAMQLPDFKTIHGCCKLGETLLKESIARYSVEALLGSMRYSCDSSAESMRTAFTRLPDGDYVGVDSIDADGIDADEEYNVRVAVKVRGDQVEVDFSGSSRQARTSINAGALDAKSAVAVSLKILLDPSSSFTSGSFRDIDIVIPPGTIASALPPEGPIFLYWEVESVILAALCRALSDALGEDAIGGDFGSNNTHNAYGTREDGTEWTATAVSGGEYGPWGGSKAGDGDGCTCTYLMNVMSPSIESLEAALPLLMLRREFAPDSAGAGLHRGGAAITRDTRWTVPAEHQTNPLRFRHPSGLGVHGGGDGALGGVWIFQRDGGSDGEEILIGTEPSVYAAATPVAGTLDPETLVPHEDGTFFHYGRSSSWRTEIGAMWRYTTNGAGGWGAPLERDPELVKRDVRDGYVSVAAAERDYGTIIRGDPDRDPEGLTIDLEATENLRGAK